MLFSLLKHYLDTDTALKVSQSVYCFTTSISHGVENYFPRLWGTGISDAILHNCVISIDSYSPVNKFYSFIIVSPDESRGYLGFSMVMPPPPHRFPFGRNNLKIF